MIERFIYTALREGIDTLQKDLSILDDLFTAQHGLSKTELAAIRKLFKERPPSVIHGYARADSKFPLYSIILSGEGESQKFLGGDAGIIDDPDDPDDGADVLSAVWEHTHQIMVYSDHPDVTNYYYEIAKSILLAAASGYFVQQGMFGFQFSGMDLAPDPRYIPENLFLRQFTMRCQREFQRLDKSVGKAFKVTGIYVDASGSFSDVGGVKTNVTFLDEG